MKNYKMTATITITVYDVEAEDEQEARCIVYDTFKNNADGVVESIDIDVLEEEDLGGDEEEEWEDEEEDAEE